MVWASGGHPLSRALFAGGAGHKGFHGGGLRFDRAHGLQIIGKLLAASQTYAIGPGNGCNAGPGSFRAKGNERSALEVPAAGKEKDKVLEQVYHGKSPFLEAPWGNRINEFQSILGQINWWRRERRL